MTSRPHCQPLTPTTAVYTQAFLELSVPQKLFHATTISKHRLCSGPLQSSKDTMVNKWRVPFPRGASGEAGARPKFTK